MAMNGLSEPDHSMEMATGAQSEPKDNEHHAQSTLSSFCAWIRSIEGKLHASNAAPTSTARIDLLKTLQTALSEKHRSYLLSSAEARLHSALSIFLLSATTQSQTAGLISDVTGVAQFLEVHDRLTRDSNGSALDVAAFQAYTSLTFSLHWAYLGIDPQAVVDKSEPWIGQALSVALSSSSSSSSSSRPEDQHGNTSRLASKDPLLYWTATSGGPRLNSRGNYLASSLPSIPTAQQAEAAGVRSAWDALLGKESVRERIREANSRVAGDSTNSHKIWRPYLAFEMVHWQLERSTDATKLVEGLFLARLAIPHADIDDTYQLMSTFVTNALPSAVYEETMSNSAGLVGKSRAIIDACDPYEQGVRHAEANKSDQASLIAAWKYYLRWAINKTEHTKGKAGGSLFDVDSASALFERAIAQVGYPMQASSSAEAPSVEVQEIEAKERSKESRQDRESRVTRESQAMRDGQDACQGIWREYTELLNASQAPRSLVIDVVGRANKSLPSSGSLWGSSLRLLGKLRVSRQHIEETLSKALSTGEVQARGAANVVDVLLARIDVERESQAANFMLTEPEIYGRGGSSDAHAAVVRNPQTFLEVYTLIEWALETVRSMEDQSRGKGKDVGDTALRLEKMASRWCELGGEDMIALAEPIWEHVLKAKRSNVLSWREAAAYWARRGVASRARAILKQGLERRDLDSTAKVQLADDLVDLEHCLGTLSDVEVARGRRIVEQEKAWEAYNHYYTQQQQSYGDVEMNDGEEASTKRKADDDTHVKQQDSNATELTTFNPATAVKRGKPDEKKPQRDREFCSVMVSNLPAFANEKDSDEVLEKIETLFKDCGEITEITGPRLVGAPESSAALVEFADRSSIPAAHTKDKKRVNGQSVQVDLGYECTLYVTNFPEEADDLWVRTLFSSYGDLFEVRWPSKRFASSRRFCYVQFTTRQSAAAALIEHHKVVGQSPQGDVLKLEVLASDPARRKVRSDAASTERELYVTRLPRSATVDALRTMFEAEGDVEDVRMPTHPDGKPKGVAFIDMKTKLDAEKAMQVLDGARLKGKAISVSKAQAKGSGPGRATSPSTSKMDAERRSRCVKARGLPLDAQEAIIQQLFEKTAGGSGNVLLVEYEPGKEGHGIATIEFKDASIAGKVLLSSTIQYDEQHMLTLSPLEHRGAAAAAAASTSMAPHFAPRQVGRGGARGRGRGGFAPGIGFTRNSQSTQQSPQGQAQKEATETMDVDGSEPSPSVASTVPKTQDAFRELLQRGK